MSGYSPAAGELDRARQQTRTAAAGPAPPGGDPARRVAPGHQVPPAAADRGQGLGGGENPAQPGGGGEATSPQDGAFPPPGASGGRTVERRRVEHRGQQQEQQIGRHGGIAGPPEGSRRRTLTRPGASVQAGERAAARASAGGLLQGGGGGLPSLDRNYLHTLFAMSSPTDPEMTGLQARGLRPSSYALNHSLQS
jgi:hypothetical protein